ncbi:hypothetical protein [Neorhodopirellula lusitana]|uniref:hypothetical protein n=1 Tax=Neorhodopirellula lusitana TaxID=445327 RepID=UPI0024B81E25|nr:hypothetical protein [Neorhodopirellula lusitana]
MTNPADPNHSRDRLNSLPLEAVDAALDHLHSRTIACVMDAYGNVDDALLSAIVSSSREPEAKRRSNQARLPWLGR